MDEKRIKVFLFSLYLRELVMITDSCHTAKQTSVLKIMLIIILCLSSDLLPIWCFFLHLLLQKSRVPYSVHQLERINPFF